MAKIGGLGKGLDSLIGGEFQKEAEVISGRKKAAEKREAKNSQTEIMMKISQIEPNREQPRKQFEEDSLAELAESLKLYGVIQPLIVRKKDGYYEIVAGERRWRAAKMAGLKEVPVIIKAYSEREIAEISLVENLQREDLNPIEEAMAYQRLLKEFHLKQEEVAERVSKSRTVITNSLRLLRLDSKVQTMLIEGLITTGHAKVLLALDDQEQQILAAEKIVDERLSVRETENFVKQLLSPKAPKEKKVLGNEILYHTIEDRMKEMIGTKVHIQRKDEDKGKIEIEYYSADDLERIMEIMGIYKDNITNV